MKSIIPLLIILCQAQLFAQEHAVQNSLTESEKIAVMLADAQLDGYNNRDIEAFLAPYSDDVEVYTFPDILRYKGKDEMRKNYSNMFSNVPDLHCSILNRVVFNNQLIDHEEVRVNGNIITAVAIYQIKNNKIAKVYFLPR